MTSSLLGEALDDVREITGESCDGFSSSVFNCIITMTSGIALSMFNYGIASLGYQAPTATRIPVQTEAIQNFLIFSVLGIQVLVYPAVCVLAGMMKRKSGA